MRRQDLVRRLLPGPLRGAVSACARALPVGVRTRNYLIGSARDIGWSMVLVYIVCCCMRLARFNVNRDAPDPGTRAHFVGVPAPAAAR